MPYQDIEESRMYRLAEEIADEVWEIVSGWPDFAKDALGKQLVRSVDSVGANIAESAGRFHPRDVINFLYFARGSIKESRWHLRRALKRDLIGQAQFDGLTTKLDQIAKELNSYIGFQKTRIVKDTSVAYAVDPLQDTSLDEPTNQPAN